MRIQLGWYPYAIYEDYKSEEIQLGYGGGLCNILIVFWGVSEADWGRNASTEGSEG